MGSEDNSTPDLGSNSASSTVQELISKLRSSFFSIDFQNVAITLIEREEHMNRKYIKLETEAEEEKKSLSSKNLKLADELKKKEKELDSLRKENLEFLDQIDVLNSEKSRVSKNLELEDELKKKQSEIDATKRLNAELERRVRVYENRCLDFDNRVSGLEKLVKELMGSGSSDLDMESKQQYNCAAESSRPPLFTETKDSNKRTEPKYEEIIQIIDDDDDDDHFVSTVKTKGGSNEIKRECNSHDDDDLEVNSALQRTQDSKKIKREHNCDHELHNQPITSPQPSTPQSAKIPSILEKTEPKILISSLDSSDSSSDSDEDKINEAYMSSIAKLKKENERWESEADMLKDFEKDDELCMNAICALQRQKIRVLAFDVSRISNLARLLCDGDPQRKLKKTASELCPFDLEHCRMFATNYSSHLFNIYQKKIDPFFPPRS